MSQSWSLDTESVAYLKQNYRALDGRIVEGDFLTLDLTRFADADGHLCVIGNYPYNISSQIFFHILEYKDNVTLCSGMLQREVAERIAAKEGTKTRGILSVLLQAWYDIEYLFTVSEGVFNPPPKVKSGVIRLRRNDVTDLGCDPKALQDGGEDHLRPAPQDDTQLPAFAAPTRGGSPRP